MPTQSSRFRRPAARELLWEISPKILRGMFVAVILLTLPFGFSASSIAADSGAADSGAADSGAAEPHPLSVAPLSQVEYPDDRPAWVDAPPTLGGSVDSGSVDVWPVKSLLRPTAEEARESLRVQLRGAAFAYAEQFLGTNRVRRMPAGAPLYPEIETLPAADRYAGTALRGDETVYEEAVRLRFDEAYRQRLAAAWRQAEVGRRLSVLGVAGGGGFVLLLSATGFVRRIARRRIEPSQ